MWQANNAGIAHIGVQIKRNAITIFDDCLIGNFANAEFRPLQIGKNTAWRAGFGFKRPNGINAHTLFFACAMRKIQPEDIYASGH